MNFILCFVLVAYFCFLVVSGRSLRVNSDAIVGLEVGEDVNHDQESGGLFSWIRLKPFLRQRIKNMKDVEASKVNPKPVEMSSVHSKEEENAIKRESEEPMLSAFSDEENEINEESEEPIFSKEEENAINRESEEPTLSAFSEEENAINRESEEPTLSAFSEEEEENEINAESEEPAFSKEEENAINRESEEPTLSVYSEEEENEINAKSEEPTFSKEEENTINREAEEQTLSAYSEEDENDIDAESEEPTFSVHSEEVNLITLESTESTSSTHLNEEDSAFNQDSTEGNFSTLLEDENSFSVNTSSINISGTLNTTSSVKLAETNPNEEQLVSESELPELESSMTPVVEKLKSDSYLITYGILDDTISDILNASGDSIIFQTLNDNASATESFNFDETTLLSEGDQIATLHEVSTIGFELLIDSETKQNLILAELISSQSDLISDVEDFSTVSLEPSDSSGSDLVNTETNQDAFVSPSTKFTIDVIGNRSTELNSGNSFLGEIATEVSNLDPEDPKCPDPGWCVFWFLTEDMCAKDSHCHASMKCCMWGCSKMCIDVNDELF